MFSLFTHILYLSCLRWPKFLCNFNAWVRIKKTGFRGECWLEASQAGHSSIYKREVTFASSWEKNRGIASVQIHVERTMGLLWHRYTILEGTIPSDFLAWNRNGSPCTQILMIVLWGFVLHLSIYSHQIVVLFQLLLTRSVVLSLRKYPCSRKERFFFTLDIRFIFSLAWNFVFKSLSHL